MFRLLGFLVGSATSIAIILLVTGLPEFHFKDPEIDQQRFDAAVEKLMARKQEVEKVVQQVAAEVAESVQDDLPPAGETPTPFDLQNSVALEMPDGSEILAAPQTVDFTFMPAAAEERLLADAQWYSFWNPFRSEIAANGFVSQLEKVTGLDYRVVRIKTGVYEVAFAYGDDSERRRKLSEISAATGLDLPDS